MPLMFSCNGPRFPGLLWKIILIGAFIFFAQIGFTKVTDNSWDWSKINTADIHFKPDFIFGVAGAGHQYLGAINCPHSNWASWDYARDDKGNPRISGGQHSGVACDFWNYLDHDIALMKKMQLKAFRFSIEWADIEPSPGKINEAAIRQYHILCDKLLASGIQPVLTLHHFTHPIWFEEMGGFEEEENITYFIDYCKRMVRELGSKVKMWATFNEPGVYVFQSYIRGVWPPGKKELNTGVTVLKNILQAHVQAYKAIKALAGADDLNIGLVHSISQFDAYNNNYFERQVCLYTNLLFHEAITHFFSTGIYKVQFPLIANMLWECPEAPGTLDYFGLNYYSRVVIRIDPFNLKFGQEFLEHETKTDSSYAEYAQGLYRAIKDVSERIKVPRGIYITENGIPDHKDDRRKLFIERYLYALYKAIKDGYDVRGYFYWSFLDNFEWTEGYDLKFGLYEVNMKTQERTLRDGAQAYIRVIEQTYNKKNNPTELINFK
jgi:beta-glucosidase